MEEKEIYELSCNVDDMTGEEMAFAMEQIVEAGARDVFVEQILMKKGRPGMMLKVLVDADKKDYFAKLIFKHTTTIGIRENKLDGRYVMRRDILEADTQYGKVHMKVSDGYGTNKTKLEFEDIKKIALENGISIYEVKDNL